jgi:4-diphosphocytidyl-2-C-methyl-D-erythritol kinase
VKRVKAHAKINLGLVAGPLRSDGKHEIVTVLQRIDLHDDIAFEPADGLDVEGFAGDTLVRNALESLGRAAGIEPGWRVHIEKRIPVAAGLGGGSTDAAAALQLANATLAEPLEAGVLHRLAADVGADVPFFLHDGTQLASGDGTELAPVALPTDYHVVLVVPHDPVKVSTADVYAAFDARSGAEGFAGRAASFRAMLASVASTSDLATLPPNDLSSSTLADELLDAGAFRADVSGAGPTVYGLFERVDDAHRAAKTLAAVGDTHVTHAVHTVDPP